MFEWLYATAPYCVLLHPLRWLMSMTVYASDERAQAVGQCSNGFVWNNSFLISKQIGEKDNFES